jgi:branched-chain amino acid transport system permease protein
MSDLFQALGSGILVGLVYSLLGLCIVIIYKASEAFNFAIGEFMITGSFLFYVLFFDLRIPFVLAFPLGMAAAAVVGAIIETLTIRPLIGRSPISMTIITLGLSFLIRASLQLIFGSHSYSFFLELPDISIEAGDLLFLSDPLWAGMLSIAAFALVIFLLFKTKWGLAIRATSESQAKAMAFGINARLILLIVWGASSACIAIAGVMISNFGALSTMSSIVGLRAIPVVLIGGMDSIGGALAGGIIVGVCESLVGAYVEPMGLTGFKEVAPYILLLIVVLIRPYGLFGTARIERV